MKISQKIIEKYSLTPKKTLEAVSQLQVIREEN
jgi:hypothetical protein